MSNYVYFKYLSNWEKSTSYVSDQNVTWKFFYVIRLYKYEKYVKYVLSIMVLLLKFVTVYNFFITITEKISFNKLFKL